MGRSLEPGTQWSYRFGHPECRGILCREARDARIAPRAFRADSYRSNWIYSESPQTESWAPIRIHEFPATLAAPSEIRCQHSYCQLRIVPIPNPCNKPDIFYRVNPPSYH